MAKYKISKENLSEFFGLFKSNKPKDRAAIEKMIAQHPGLKAISKKRDEIDKMAKKQIENDPWVQDFLKKHNIDLKDTFK